MPDYHSIMQEVQNLQANPPGDAIRKKYVSDLHSITKRNTILYYSAWQQKDDKKVGIDDYDMNGFMSMLPGLDRKQGLDLILHTPGGDLAATEAIGEYLKKQFNNDIRVIVPHLAMSGGTLLAFAAKTIIMGNHSSLGPIDPMISGLPAHGVCEEFNRAVQEVSANPVMIEIWKHIIAQYEPSFIGECQNAVNWSNEIATRWLSDGMFSNTKSDEERDIAVRAIVDTFGDHGATKSHSRHVMIEQCRTLGLNILALENNSKLQDAVLSVHHACLHTLGVTHVLKLMENHKGKTYAIIGPPPVA